ncbi:DNA recombination protein RmuC [hydrothermal vent metagenome]|uniref:DNA recombination protein RmuC n=1 Tax=hydrothermal vent metagenome TaxID=652676 RepID=A0A3B1B1W6_9ZZZZ
MSDTFIYLAIILSAAAFGVLGAWMFLQNRISSLRERNTQLATTLELQEKNAEEKMLAMTLAHQQAQQQIREQLSDTFSNLSRQALKHNSDEFLKLAQENLKQFQSQAQADLGQKEKAIEHLIKPIQEALQKTEQQIQGMEKERREAYGALHTHLQSMTQAQASLSKETRNLVNALRRPEVRGQWGEMTLKRLAELAGMVEHCDFYEQESIRTDEGQQRPDMIIRMPDGREIVVDVKTPLDAYLNAIEKEDDESRDQELVRHARNVRNRVNELAAKAYWAQFKNSPDFIVLFIPGDQFLGAALDKDPDLLEDALRQQVILATPTSFVALLRAVGYGWRQEQLAENADKIKQVGEELYNRLGTFANHLQKLGRSLESSTKHYNSAVGSFDSRILPSAQKFTDMGISAAKKLQSSDQIGTSVRTMIVDDTEKED